MTCCVGSNLALYSRGTAWVLLPARWSGFIPTIQKHVRFVGLMSHVCITVCDFVNMPLLFCMDNSSDAKGILAMESEHKNISTWCNFLNSWWKLGANWESKGTLRGMETATLPNLPLPLRLCYGFNNHIAGLKA